MLLHQWNVGDLQSGIFSVVVLYYPDDYYYDYGFPNDGYGSSTYGYGYPNS